MAENNAGGFMDRLIKKAWESESFKHELLANPRAAIENELGVKVPDNIEVVAVADTPTKLHVVVPMSPASASPRVSDEELEKVAGGSGISWGCCSRSGGP